MKNVYIRGEIAGSNAAGQKRVHILASNADGLYLWTNDKSIIDLSIKDDDAARAIRIIDAMQDPEAWEPMITQEAFNALQMAKEALEWQRALESGKLDRAKESIPVSWISDQIESYPGMESAMWSKLLRLWNGRAITP